MFEGALFFGGLFQREAGRTPHIFCRSNHEDFDGIDELVEESGNFRGAFRFCSVWSIWVCL